MYRPETVLEKQQREQAKLFKERTEKMLKAQMETYLGRQFVLDILASLEYNKPNLHNSAQAYRIAAKQEVAIFIYNKLYEVAPDKCELMMREAQNNR